jgi:hypothetical protein
LWQLNTSLGIAEYPLGKGVKIAPSENYCARLFMCIIYFIPLNDLYDR